MTRHEKLLRVCLIRDCLDYEYNQRCSLRKNLYEHQRKRLNKIEDILVTHNGKYEVTIRPTEPTLIRC